MDLNNHPCFNDKKRHTFGRIHLPVAPKCNIQCNYCVRKYDCINESKPGVTSQILSPEEALIYLDKVIEKRKNISVVGIAGPGDPFANPQETMKTLKLVREKYPDMLLCIATNGLNILPYINDLAELGVSHVTLTINAVDPEIGAKIYSWVRDGIKIYHKNEAAGILIKKQLEAITMLKEKKITVKINTIIIPSINDNHIGEVVETTHKLGADIMNCIPMIANKGSVFENIKELDKTMVAEIRAGISKIMPQMYHCNRCRADAAGLIYEKMNSDDFNLLKTVSQEKYNTVNKKYIAVGSREKLLINQHLGEISKILIYVYENQKPVLIDIRTAPEPGKGDMRWEEFAEIIKDCFAIVVSGSGSKPENIFLKHGIRIIKTEGLINDVVERLFSGKKIFEKTEPVCGKGLICSGTGNGCG